MRLKSYAKRACKKCISLIYILFFGSTQVKGLISLILMSTKLGKERFSSYRLNVSAHIVTSTM